MPISHHGLIFLDQPLPRNKESHRYEAQELEADSRSGMLARDEHTLLSCSRDVFPEN
jgi:hypothetical protein